MQNEGLPQFSPHPHFPLIPRVSPEVTNHSPIWARELSVRHDGYPVFDGG